MTTSIRDTEPTILADAGAWLVINKPAGWHSVRGKTEASDEGGGVVETWLAQRMPELASIEESGMVHRLDRDTSGCLVVARDSRLQTDLRRRFSLASDVRKIYVARCRPGLAVEGASTLFYSSRHKGSAKISVRDRGEPHEAGRLRWTVREQSSSGDLVEVELIGPGRRHQIRAGLAFLGAALIGDTLYGGVEASGVQLHAWKLLLDDRTVEAPLPAWAARTFASTSAPRSEQHRKV